MLRLYVICVALVACACRETQVEKLEKIRDEVCACKDATCAEAALERVPKQDVESTARAQRVARDMLDCLAEIYERGRPTQDPDAPSEEPEEAAPTAPSGEAGAAGPSAPAPVTP